MADLKNIDIKISEILWDIIELRRHIHQYPELGYEEVNTSKLVAKELASYGIEVKEGVGGNGVVGLLAGEHSGKTLLLRADMDALPIREETGLPFASKIPGKMHACGHDMHTAILLGVARVLSEYRQNILGNVKFMFQPAEECNPEGGAKAMIDAGVLENPKVDYALALHVWPDLAVGDMGLGFGPFTSQSDRLFIRVLGSACHASSPHLGVDAMVAAAEVITSLQHIISRRIDPRDCVVITLGKISGGDRYNVICDRVELEGTVRIMTPGYEDKIPQLIAKAGEGAVMALGAKFEMEYLPGYPMVFNDEALGRRVVEILSRELGEASVKWIRKDTSGEDFAYISRRVPSVYMKLGASPKGEEKDAIPLHNSKVIFDEDCIPVGIKALTTLSLNLLISG